MCIHASFGFGGLRFNLCVELPRQGTQYRASFTCDVFVETFFVFEMVSVTIEGAVQIVPCTTFFFRCRQKILLQFLNAAPQSLNAHTFMKLSTVFMALNSIQHIHRTIVMSTKPFSEGWIVARKGEYSA